MKSFLLSFRAYLNGGKRIVCFESIKYEEPRFPSDVNRQLKGRYIVSAKIALESIKYAITKVQKKKQRREKENQVLLSLSLRLLRATRFFPLESYTMWDLLLIEGGGGRTEKMEHVFISGFHAALRSLDEIEQSALFRSLLVTVHLGLAFLTVYTVASYAVRTLQRCRVQRIHRCRVRIELRGIVDAVVLVDIIAVCF